MNIVNTMLPQDQDKLLERLEVHQAAGMSPKEAQRAAANDVLDGLQQERRAVLMSRVEGAADDSTPGAGITKPMLVDPTTLTFRELDQNRKDELTGDTDEFDPIVLIDEDGELSILDGHNRASVAIDRGDSIKAVKVTQAEYSRLQSKGFEDGEIAWAALQRAEQSYAAGNLDSQFPGSEISKGGDKAWDDLIENESTTTDSPALSRSQDQTDTPAFKAWFEGSKVVNADGSPLVVYHGTGADISEFKTEKIDGGIQGAWFTSNPSLSGEYAVDRAYSANKREFFKQNPHADRLDKDFGQSAANVMPVYLMIKNPLRVEVGDIAGVGGMDFVDSKYDGVIVGDFEEVIVRNPAQIKSAISNGAFDPANPDIRYSRRVITNPAATGYTLDPETKWLQARRKLQDYFIRVQSVQEAISGQGGILNDATNTYLAEERTYGHINETMIDFANNQVEPMVALAAKKGIDANEMSLYAYAKHAQERNERIASINLSMPDGGSGMTNAEAAAILDKVKADGKEADYEAIHQRLMAITAATRLKLLDGGLITQAHFDAMEAAYSNYVPLRGFELADEETGSPSGLRTGRGFNIRGQETMRALGRSSRAGDLIENVISDFERATIRVERNEVAKVFLNFAQKNPDPTLWQIDANRTKQAYDRTTGLVGKTTMIEKGEDTISCKINGHEIYIQIHDPLLVRALRKAAKDETGEAERFLGKTIGLYSTLLRNTLTRFNPEFAVVNTARDFGFGTVAVLDELGEKGVLKFWKHYAGALAISGRYEAGRLANGNADWQRWFEEYRASGATTGGFYQQDAAETRKDIRQMMLMAGATPVTKMEAVQKSSPYRAMLAAGRVLEFAGATSEHAARVAAYRTAREMGKTVPQAASIAKNLTTNFNRKGEVGGILNTLFLFFNAGVQGTHRMAKMMQNKRVLAYMAGATAASATLALMNVTMGGDDEDEQPYWDKIPAHLKERNLIIMLPPGFEADGVKKVGAGGRYLMIPMQYGLNIFPALGYSLSDVARYSQNKTHGKSPMVAAVQMGAVMLGAFNPIGGSVDNKYALAMMPMPTAIDLPFQLALGVNGFGREVAPPRYNGDTKPNSENATLRQTGGPFQKVAQWVSSVTGGDAAEGGMVDMSPGTYENIWGSLTGGTGRFITDVLALGGKGFDAATGGSPDLFTRDIPIYRKLTGAVDGDVNQGLFYERRSQAVSARAKERAKLEIGRELTNSQELAYSAMDGSAKNATRSLASIRKQIISLRKDDAIPAPEKRVQERELKATRDELIMGFNAQWMDAMKAEAAGDFSVAEN
jgi:hypothetical protein